MFLIVDRSQRKLLRLQRMHVDVRLQENPSHGKRDTTEKNLCTPPKVPLIIDRSKQNLPRL